MFHLVHIDLPFWEVLESHEDEQHLDDMVLEYPTIPCGDIDILSDEELDSLRIKYPQARHQEQE